MDMIKGAVSLISVVAGVMAGYHCDTVWAAIAVILIAIGVRGSAVRIMRRNIKKLRIASRLHSVWPCLLMSGLAMFSADMTLSDGEELPLKEPCMLSGVVKESASTTMGGRYLVQLNGIRRGLEELPDCNNINVWLFASAMHALEPGDEISWESVLLPAEDVRPGGVRYLTYDMVRLYDGKVHKKSGKERYTLRDGHLEVTGRSRSLQSMAWRWRNRIAILLETSGLGDESVRLLRTLLTGERSGMRPDRRELFRDAGVSHTLAVSGMHVGIIAGLLIWLTIPLNLLPGAMRWRVIFVLAGVWAFTVFTGMMYSTLRAAFMITLAGIGRMTGRFISPFHGVCMAGVVILLLSPEALWDVGFQLSFLCVAGLTVFSGRLNPVDIRRRGFLYKLVEPVIATLVSTGVTWPLTARYFGALPMNFMSCNLLMLPLLPVLMVAGIIHVIMAGCGVESHWLAEGIDGLVNVMFSILSYSDGAVVEMSPSGLSVILWLCAAALIAVSLHRHTCSPRWFPGAVVASAGRRNGGRVSVWQPAMWGGIVMVILSLCMI